MTAPLIPPTKGCKCPDMPRYKALGNAVTVPVAEWIARRILEAEGMTV
jgi:site-specific DNA-cytosine methylase